jgi:hypothetical protein
MIGYYTMQGEPCSLVAAFSGDRTVGKDDVPLEGGVVQVSTVHLGLDHRMPGDEGPPIIFETMLFTDHDDHPLEMQCQRWRTLAEAQAGHDQAVAALRAGGLPEWVVA